MFGFKMFNMKKSSERETGQPKSNNTLVTVWDARVHPLARVRPLDHSTITGPKQSLRSPDDGLMDFGYPPPTTKHRLSFKSARSGSPQRLASEKVRKSRDAADAASEKSSPSEVSQKSIRLYEEARRRGSADLYQRKKVKRTPTKAKTTPQVVSGNEGLRSRIRRRWALRPLLFMKEARRSSQRFSLDDTDFESEEKIRLASAEFPLVSQRVRFPLLGSNEDPDSDSDYERSGGDEEHDTPSEVQNITAGFGTLVMVEEYMDCVAQVRSATLVSDDCDE